MNGVLIGWLSFSPIFKTKFIDQLSLYHCHTICLVDADKPRLSCLILHSEELSKLQNKIFFDIQQTCPDIPTIFISDVTSTRRAELLKKGIDDVVSANIHYSELYERIIKLHQLYDKKKYCRQIGFFEIDYLKRSISFNNIFLPLKPREYLLLEFLLRHSPKPISRSELLLHLWNCKHEPGTNSVEVHIWRLRQKLAEYIPEYPIILTVRRRGYQIIIHEGDQTLNKIDKERASAIV